MRPAERLQRLLARPRDLIAAGVVLQWFTTLLVALRADGIHWGPVEVLNLVVLGPLALVCAFRVAACIGGPALSAWTLLVWALTPWLARAFTLASYDETLRDRVLPLALGLTSDPGYAAGVALLASTALLTLPDWRAAVAGGAVAGGAALLTPTAVVFVAPAVLSLVVARRPRESALFLAPALSAMLAAWLWRDLSFGELSVDRLQENMAGLREYFWSQRLLQWLPLAGAIGVARRSVPLAILLGGWFGAFVAFRLTSSSAFFERGGVFHVLLPALPAYVLLAAALPLLVPTLATRLGALAQPVEPP
jgi:hypothetical protein